MERLDEQGYPTQEFLDYIKAYDFIHSHPMNLFDIIEEVWWGGEWRHKDTKDRLDQDVHQIGISTWGWSGNEEIIDAMSQNFLLWSMYWVSNERGGHFIFEIPFENE